MTTRNTFFTRGGTDSFYGGPNRKNTIRPESPESVTSDDSEVKLTKDQHDCVNNLGMMAAFFLPIGLISGGIGMGTTYWFNVQHYYVGLFQRCDNWTQICQSVSTFYDENNTDKLKTTWTIGVPLLFIGIAFLLIGLVGVIFYPCHRKVNFSKVACAVTTGVMLLLGLLAFAAGVGMFLMYAVSNPNSAKSMWSFYCAEVGAAFLFLSTLLFWIHVFYTACFDT